MGWQLKRLANAFRSTRPRSIGTFEEERLRVSLQYTHRPERLVGVMRTQEVPAVWYPSIDVLENQVSLTEFNGKPRLRSPGLLPMQNLHLYAVNDACVAGADGFVWLPATRKAIAETISQYFDDAADHAQFRSPRFPKPKQLSGLTLSIVTLAGGGFHHFLLESLSRLCFAKPFWKCADWFLVNGSPDAFQADWLQQAGIDLKKVVFVNERSHFRCEHLLFSSIPSLPGAPSRWMVDSVREMYGHNIDEGAALRAGRKVWISREDAATRHIEWESGLLRALGDFELVSCTKLNSAEQVDLFRSASVIAGPHGAGLTNMIFSKPGTKVIEFIEESKTHIQIFSRLASVCGHAHGVFPVDFKDGQSVEAKATTMRNFIGI